MHNSSLQNRDFSRSITKVISLTTNRFKIDISAKKHMLTGLCIIPDQTLSHTIPSLIVVEGGQWAIKKYKKLLLRRIKWTQTADKLEEADKARISEEIKNNRATLVWEGIVKKRIFDRWRVVEVRNEAEARRLLADKAVVYFARNNLGKLLECCCKL